MLFQKTNHCSNIERRGTGKRADRMHVIEEENATHHHTQTQFLIVGTQSFGRFQHELQSLDDRGESVGGVLDREMRVHTMELVHGGDERG